MKTRSLLFVSALAAAAASQAAGLAGNSIAVYQVGNGSAALTSAATPTFVVNFNTTQGSPALGTYAVPTTASGANNILTDSGTASSDGQLTLSGDGKTLLFGGYNAVVGTASVAGTANPRVVGALNIGTGNIATSTTVNSFSGNNIRSVYSADSATYFAAGANTASNAVASGTLGTSDGSTLPAQTGNVVNGRYVSAFGGSLYFSTGSGVTRGIYQVDPISGAQNNAVNLGGSASPYAFQFLTSTLVVVADDNSVANGGGIKLYSLVGSTPTLLSSIATPSRSFAIANGSIYFTDTGTGTAASLSNLYSATLTGTTLGAPGLLQTAPVNTIFHGVAFVPQAVPEPSAFAALGLGALGLLRRRRKV